MTHIVDRPPTLSVLVVDDLADAADTTAAVLTLSGFAAVTAYSGEQAVEAAAACPPDVVLFDLHMPGGMDGWELALRLRESAGEKRPLLVAVTAAAAEADKAKSDAAGIDLHLIKPVDPATLVGLIRRFDRVVSASCAVPPE